jgi:hypothetical protein
MQQQRIAMTWILVKTNSFQQMYVNNSHGPKKLAGTADVTKATKQNRKTKRAALRQPF